MESSLSTLQKRQTEWEALAQRADVIGKRFTYTHHQAEVTERGTIRRIRIENGRAIIEFDELEGKFKARRGYSPNLRFRIKEDGLLSTIGDTIFYDDDSDAWQLQIHMTPARRRVAIRRIR
jgi:hypothetical protein